MTDRSDADYVQLKVRMKEPLRAQVEMTARARGVSLNSEAVRRLECSLEQDSRIADVFGDEQTFAVMRMLAATIHAEGIDLDQFKADALANITATKAGNRDLSRWLDVTAIGQTVYQVQIRPFDSATRHRLSNPAPNSKNEWIDGSPPASRASAA